MSKKSSKKKKNNIFIKLLRVIYRFFEAIYRVIDKFIITPITKLLMIFVKLLKTNNKPFEILLHNKLFLITISLVLALVAFFVIDEDTNVLLTNSAEVLYNQSVTALYNEEAYVVEGLPENVDITLIGRRSDLYLAKQYPSDEVVVDLRDLKPGTHTVSLKYNGSVSSVDYKLDPSTATVVVYEKISESKSLAKEIMNEDKLDSKFSITDIKFDRDEVFVKGADYKLKQVAIVKALIDINQIVNPTIGNTTLKDIPLVAYDKDGNKLNVEIVPSKINATLSISSPSKEIPIKVIPQGDVVFGKAINNIDLSIDKVTVYGDEDALTKLSYLPVEIDVKGLEKGKEYNVNLTKPTGIKELSANTIKIKVELDNIVEKTIDNVSISTKNLKEGLLAKAASEKDSLISVIVKGTETNIKAITRDNISAYVDLQGLGVGTHNVKVTVSGDDLKLTYTPVTATVKINIK